MKKRRSLPAGIPGKIKQLKTTRPPRRACCGKDMETNRTTETDSPDPLEHTKRIKERFNELVDHLREDAHKVNDARARALFETSAEVLMGLHKAFSDYEKKSEAAWRL